MFRYFDASFLAGGALTIVAIAIAFAAVTSASLPVVGGARGALLAVAVLGFAACPVAGSSQATAVGWLNPAILLGCVFGVLALLVIGAGVAGWDSVVRPVAQFVPGSLAVDLSTERLAVAALASILLVKLLLSAALVLWRGAAAQP